MADNFTIDFNGLDKDIATVINKYPDETEKFMRKEATKWKKDCNDNGYGKYTGATENSRLKKKGIEKKIKPISKCWKTVKEENIWHQVNEVQIQNKSQIFHLLENGHVKWLFGKNTGGYVPGKHWAEKTREEWKQTFPSDVKGHVDEMLGRHNL